MAISKVSKPNQYASVGGISDTAANSPEGSITLGSLILERHEQHRGRLIRIISELIEAAGMAIDDGFEFSLVDGEQIRFFVRSMGALDIESDYYPPFPPPSAQENRTLRGA